MSLLISLVVEEADTGGDENVGRVREGKSELSRGSSRRKFEMEESTGRKLDGFERAEVPN